MKFSVTKSRLLTLIFVVSGLASAPLQLVSGRDRIEESLRMYENATGASASFTLLSRLLNLALAVLLVAVMSKTVRKKISMTAEVWTIFLALGVYLSLNYWLGSVFGSYPGLPSLYPFFTIIFLMSLCLVKDLSPATLVQVFRYVASIMVLGSLASGIIVPEWSYMAETSYSFGDGGAKRLIGLFSHPSVVGLYGLMLFIVELRYARSSVFRTVNLIACPLALIMSLSKTAIILAIIVCIWHIAKKGIAGLVVLSGIALGLFAVTTKYSGIASLFKSNESFTTLTGRTQLWDFILSNWTKNPLFGNGPAFFSSFGNEKFSHAHNIVIQAISDGGLLGLLGLLFYIFAIFRIAYLNRKSSKYLSVLLATSLFVFSLTEPVMRIDSFLNGLFFVNAFVILYLCSLERSRIHGESLTHSSARYTQYGHAF